MTQWLLERLGLGFPERESTCEYCARVKSMICVSMFPCTLARLKSILPSSKRHRVFLPARFGTHLPPSLLRALGLVISAMRRPYDLHAASRFYLTADGGTLVAR